MAFVCLFGLVLKAQLILIKTYPLILKGSLSNRFLLADTSLQNMFYGWWVFFW